MLADGYPKREHFYLVEYMRVRIAQSGTYVKFKKKHTTKKRTSEKENEPANDGWNKHILWRTFFMCEFLVC